MYMFSALPLVGVAKQRESAKTFRRQIGERGDSGVFFRNCLTICDECNFSVQTNCVHSHRRGFT
jgi:hypothetical protein